MFSKKQRKASRYYNEVARTQAKGRERASEYQKITGTQSPLTQASRHFRRKV